MEEGVCWRPETNRKLWDGEIVGILDRQRDFAAGAVLGMVMTVSSSTSNFIWNYWI